MNNDQEQKRVTLEDVENFKTEIDRVMVQGALLSIQETMSRKCFKICINNPGDKLTGKEKQCLGYCVDRYLEAIKIISNKVRDASFKGEF